MGDLLGVEEDDREEQIVNFLVSNSITNSNASSTNLLNLENSLHTAGKIWRLGKRMGMSYGGSEEALIAKFAEFEERDRLGFAQTNQGDVEGFKKLSWRFVMILFVLDYRALAREFSDHCPVVLRYKKYERGPSPFRFNNCCLQPHSFENLVLTNWENSTVMGCKAFIIKEKLKILKEAIKSWNRETFGCLNTKLGDLARDIQALDIIGESTSLDANQVAEKKMLIANWWRTTIWKDSILRQEFLEQVVKKGDVNTSFFHACINNRRRRNQILGVWIDGVWCEEKKLIMTGVSNYFKNLFTHVPSPKPTLAGVEFRRLYDSQRATLDVIFSEEEIRLAVWSCAGRLKGVIGSIISSSQSAFIQDRNILDATVVVNEIIHSAKKNKDRCLLLKVDFEKAYNSVDWSFLDYMLSRFGFSDKWRKLINACLCSTSMSVLINGTPSKQFFVSKGIRQGDHMAPFLFIMVAEGFVGLVRNVKRIGLFEGYKIGSQGVEVCDLQFADNTILAPKKVLSKLTNLRMRFLWGNKIGSKGIAWVSWLEVCKPKSLGGLGVRDLVRFNEALLGKWRWCRIQDKEALWVKVINSKYGHDLSFSCTANASRW
ncbi:PREDICTED: uncharacterized protein LOC109363636 [Lupinus angustifolius]|uniref:uncharacterized protein LOC109363636 n=1 Tax=Lupinus angustifolius TaxID=3871 RepID=UPI00092EACC7|nr:PREDICTED: uncharacterized protein LOC109363636 [Lupinus angustifolius]